MNSKFILVATIASTLIPCVAFADASNFDRQRTVAVGERVPTGYEALGLRAGAFTVYPDVLAGIALDDNIYYTDVSKKSDTILSVAPSVVISSNWSRHALRASLEADWENYAKYDTENTLFWSAGASGRIDVHGRNNIFAAINASENHEPRYDPSTPQDAAEPVKFDGLTSNLGFTLEGNRLKFVGAMNYQKLDYFDVRSQTAGVIIDQDDRDYSRTGLSARVDYAWSPALSVYGQYEVNDRKYRQGIAGRDSDGYNFALGASFDVTNLLRGEAAIGYLKQNYDNPIYKSTGSSFLSASIEYFPTPLTTVALRTSRSVEETPYVGAAGYLSTATVLSVDHELLRNLVLSAAVGSTDDDYQDYDRHDQRTRFNVGAKYLLSRNVSLRAGYYYAKNESRGSLAIRSYTDSTVKVTLGLQY